MEPVYCSSIITTDADSVPAIKFNNFLKRVICEDILQKSGYLPGAYMIRIQNSVKISTVSYFSQNFESELLPFRPNVVNCDPSFLSEIVQPADYQILGLPEKEEIEGTECFDWCAQYSVKPSKVC